MTAHTKVGGAWKNVPEIHVKVGGTWKAVAEGWTKVGGAWKQFFSTGYEEWVKYTDVALVRYGRITWNGSTAVLASSVNTFNNSGYSSDPSASITAGGTMLDRSSQLESANGVVINIQGLANSKRIQRSTDNGTTWSTVMNLTDTGDAIRGASYKAGRWVVAELGDNDVWTSDDDGATWTVRNSVLGSALNWIVVTNNGTNFIVLRDDSSTGSYYYSADGITWTAVAMSNLSTSNAQIGNFNYKNPVGANGIFMAHQGDRVRTSTDGINWTTKVNLATNLDDPKLAYGDGVWVAVGFESAVLKTYKSIDAGATWTAVPLTGYAGSSTAVPDITFYNNKFWITSINASNYTDIFVLEK